MKMVRLMLLAAAAFPAVSAPARQRGDAAIVQRSPLSTPVRPGPDLLSAARSPIAPVSIRSTRLVTRPIRLLARIEAKENDMTGWTQLTNGAAKGGPAVIRSSAGTATLIVRGADDELYMTAIDPTNPGGQIDGAAWKALGFSAATEPNCQAAGNVGGGKTGFACAWLDPSGKPTFAAVGNDGVDAIDMGGISGDTRPAVVAVSGGGWGAWGGAGTSTSVQMLVRDGGSVLKRSATISQAWNVNTPQQTTTKEIDSGWVSWSGGVVGSAQCADGRCAVVNGGGLMLADPWANATSIVIPPQPVPGGYSSTAPAPVRLASGTYAVMVRNAEGRLYRITNKDGSWGKWADEGGTLKAGSSMSCIANGEQPLCVAQGLDGRIYWKKLGTAAGL